MGNNNSKQEKLNQQDYERFGSVSIIQMTDSEGEKISMMQFDKPILSETDFNNWAQLIQSIQDPQTKQVLLLPHKKVYSQERKGLCGSTGLANLTYENFPYVLDSEIKNRKNLKRHFSEPEMWYLLYNIIRAANKFQKLNNKKIGDVNPHNIVINDDGQIKVISTCSLPDEQNNFQKIVTDKQAKVYLAPEQLSQEFINKGIYNTNINASKAQVFSIGLTILSSGILQDCFDIYSKNYPRTIDQATLRGHLGVLSKLYSPYLYQTIQNMVSLRPQIRKRASDIYNQLYRFQQFILELEDFQAQNVQPGMQNSIQHQPIQYSNQPQYIYPPKTQPGYPIYQPQPQPQFQNRPSLNQPTNISSQYRR